MKNNMIENAVERIINRLIRNNMISEEDYEIHRYGLEIAMMSNVTLITSLIISA